MNKQEKADTAFDLYTKIIDAKKRILLQKFLNFYETGSGLAVRLHNAFYRKKPEITRKLLLQEH